MIAAWRMYSTAIPHDACIVLSSRMMHVLYCHPARFYKKPHRFGGEVLYLYCSLAALKRALRLLERPQANGTATGKKTSDFGLTLNYRFGKVSMLAETVYFLRKNSINLSTFCGKESINLSTFSRKRPTVYYFFTKTLQALQTLHIRE